MKWIENLILLSQDHARVDVSDTEDGEYPAEGEDIHPMEKSIDSQSSSDGELSDNLMLEDNEERIDNLWLTQCQLQIQSTMMR